MRNWNENFGTIQSLLKNLGLWQFIAALSLAAAVSIWSHLKQLQGPEIFVMALTALTCGVLLVFLVPELLHPRVKVKLTPINGPSPTQLLTVENGGSKQVLRADCTILQRRNDPNRLLPLTFRMEWEYRDLRTSGKLSHGGQRNLVIATAGETRGVDQGHPFEMKWIAITGLSVDGQREEKQRSPWNYGDELPEYDVKITVTSENRKQHVECFTVKAGQTSALEMFAIACPVTAS